MIHSYSSGARIEDADAAIGEEKYVMRKVARTTVHDFAVQFAAQVAIEQNQRQIHAKPRVDVNKLGDTLEGSALSDYKGHPDLAHLMAMRIVPTVAKEMNSQGVEVINLVYAIRNAIKAIARILV